MFGHWETIIPHIFRRVKPVAYARERIETEDGDFLDLDWAADGQEKLVVFSHGLEGSSRAKYIQGMIPRFREKGFDALAWNCRTCGGEMNRTARFYHSGASYDLDAVLNHVLKTKAYKEIYLIGFSMGGNITLKYLGEKAGALDPRIKKAIVFSVPLDLKSSTDRMTGGMGAVYTRKFVRTLNKKLRLKQAELDKLGIDIGGAHKIWDFKTWDGRFTAPLHGFASADDYYARSSSRPVLKNIRIPTLIVNALNDPFLGEGCFPAEELKGHPFVRLEMPRRGGHVGFLENGVFVSEQKALDFLVTK
jgi:predicted alpha/beta-fold hydrolase